MLFRVEPSRVREIYLNLGPDYVHVLVEPELSSAVRGLTSESDAKALYTSGRTEMQRRLKIELASGEPRPTSPHIRAQNEIWHPDDSINSECTACCVFTDERKGVWCIAVLEPRGLLL
eukprot:SAG11_NODE_7897_length_1083_cov_1.252033_1_plen_117_part_10